MSNLRKTLEHQQTIMDAANDIMYYFEYEIDYEVHLEQMLSAQTQIIGLMELSKLQAIKDRGDDVLNSTNEIALFLHDVQNYLRMLKPFIELAKEFDAEDLRPTIKGK